MEVFHGYSAGISPAVSNLKVKMWYIKKALEHIGTQKRRISCGAPLRSAPCALRLVKITPPKSIAVNHGSATGETKCFSKEPIAFSVHKSD